MPWSQYYECPFNDKGEIDMRPVEHHAPNRKGIYVIATKNGRTYNPQYIGRSGSSIWKRLKAHFSGKGNRVVASLLQAKRNGNYGGILPNALYFAFLETDEHKLIEAAYIDANDRPICNLIRARLPEGLREDAVLHSELED
ncbi:GIY-YIG nuclease family protein [Alkalinema pantanalense CENA528]|uniref:GIY-YIG nuclease family protein n=1 Tax=Alkalinema pantanalense TaxID=1620705 RepID=UPI003D6E2EBE